MTATKTQILLTIANSIMSSIYKYCNFNYYDESRFDSSIEVVCGDKVIGTCEFKVSVEVIEKEFLGDFNYPPYPANIIFIIEKITVIDLIGANGKKLPNSQRVLNTLFKLSQGTILKI